MSEQWVLVIPRGGSATVLRPLLVDHIGKNKVWTGEYDSIYWPKDEYRFQLFDSWKYANIAARELHKNSGGMLFSLRESRLKKEAAVVRAATVKLTEDWSI